MKRLSDFTVGFLLWALASACLLMGAAKDAHAQVPIYTRPSASVDLTSPGPIGGTTPNSGTFTWVSVTANAIDPLGGSVGIYKPSASVLGFYVNAALTVAINGSAGLSQGSSQAISWTASTATAAPDLQITRDAANTFAQKNSTNAQINRLYFSTTGPVYFQQSARTAGALFTGVGGAMQLSTAQTTVPTVTTNGGTGPACAGTDTAMVCTIGTAPPAAATFTVTFNGTWPAAPSCIAMRNTTGASPLVQGVVPATTTVVVNLSANLVASEKFAIQCFGVS